MLRVTVLLALWSPDKVPLSEISAGVVKTKKSKKMVKHLLCEWTRISNMVLTKCFLPILLLIGVSYGRPQSSKLDDVFLSILFEDCNKEGNQPCPDTDPEPVTEPQSPKYQSCGIQGLCVPRFLCNNNEINTSGAGVFDPRMDSPECTKPLHLCCNKPKEDAVITTTSIITSGTILPTVRPEQQNDCGHRSPDGIGLPRIVSTGSANHESEFGEFPWMVAIFYEMPDADGITNYRYACGGALIAPTVVVSAAHCVRKFVANNLTARAGDWDLLSKTELLPDQNRRVHEIILHENFNKASLHNDIALLIVDNPFIYEQNVRPICLPPLNTNFDLSRCYATGWGKNKDGKEGEYQMILKKIDLPVVPRNQCQANLRKTRLGEFYNLHESFICAGGELGKDTCTGDGGSPLVCPIEGKDNQFYQAGIVAYGVGCGEENVPGVYANVDHLRPWINEKLSQMRVDFSHFTA